VIELMPNAVDPKDLFGVLASKPLAPGATRKMPPARTKLPAPM